MGGFRSGRPGARMKAEHCRSLDVNRLHRDGCLRRGACGGLQWTRDGENIASIRFRAEETRLVLTFRFRRNGGEWQDTEQPVPLTYAACRYGGARPYFLCPGVANGRHCGRRVAKIYAGGRYFLCRHCYRLAYASQSEERPDRLLRRANRLRTRLGGQPGTGAFIERKPKGMWWRTYERIVDEIDGAEAEADAAFMARWCGRLPPEDLERLLR